jgi:large subunit ribosomal protein L6
VQYKLPAGVKAEVDKEGKLSVKSADKSLLGKVAADIRGFRPPEPYKGKGVRYQGEQITLKEGKARGKK